MTQALTLQPVEVHGGADIHLQPVEDPTAVQGIAPKGGCDPVGSPRWSRLLAGLAALCRGARAGAALLAGLATLWGDPRWSSLFLKDCAPWEGPTLEQLVEDCLPWEGPHAGAGQEREEDGAAETTRNELAASPIPRPPAPLRRRRWRIREGS